MAQSTVDASCLCINQATCVNGGCQALFDCQAIRKPRRNLVKDLSQDFGGSLRRKLQLLLTLFQFPNTCALDMTLDIRPQRYPSRELVR